MGKITNVKELRIGNLIWASDTVTNMMYREIINASLFNLKTISLDEEYIEFEGIPLTEEIIQMFGAFKDTFDDNCFVIDTPTMEYKFYLANLIDGDFYWTCNKVLGDNCFTYVHEFQNLVFALSGMELQMNLNEK